MPATPPAQAPQHAASSPQKGRMFLLTDSGVLAQEQGTQLWRSVTQQPSATDPAAAPTLAQLRSLRHNRTRRGASAHASAWGPAPLRPHESPASEVGGTVEIYNPLTATWSAVPPGARRAEVGEAVCCILPDGRMLIGGLASTLCASYDPTSNQWYSGALPTTSAGRTSGQATVIAVRLSD